MEGVGKKEVVGGEGCKMWIVGLIKVMIMVMHLVCSRETWGGSGGTDGSACDDNWGREGVGVVQ